MAVAYDDDCIIVSDDEDVCKQEKAGLELGHKMVSIGVQTTCDSQSRVNRVLQQPGCCTEGTSFARQVVETMVDRGTSKKTRDDLRQVDASALNDSVDCNNNVNNQRSAMATVSRILCDRVQLLYKSLFCNNIGSINKLL
jgi:hypothetical protein